MSRRRPISLISVPLFETSNGPLWGFIRLLLHERPPQTDALFSHKRAWTSTVFPHSRRALSCFQTDGASQPSPHASLPSQTGSHYRGSQPHHRWPFNTSLATANEPGVAAAWLDPADFPQMFISHSPAVLGWEVLSNPGSVLPLYLFIFHLFVAGSWHFKSSSEGFARPLPFFVLFFIVPRTLPNKHHLARFSSESARPRLRTSPFVYFPFSIFFFMLLWGSRRREDFFIYFFSLPLNLPLRSAVGKFVIAIFALSSCLSLSARSEFHRR